MKQTLNLQSNYSAIENGYQLWIPLDCSISIPEDDPVRLLNAVAERMDYREIEAAYSRYGRIEYSPKILTKVIIYGYMRRIVSSREIERACKENICFMYLLEGKKAPDHNTISRFRSNILLKGAGEKLRIQLIRMLIEAGMVDLKTVFIDGTKIEANANKYSFVWKKAQVKKMTKLNERIKEELPELLKKAGIRFYIRDTIQLRHLKTLMRQLKANVKKAGIKFAYGKGKLSRTSMKADGKVTLTVPVTNTGSREGAEIVQVYVKALDYPEAPIKSLKGFQKLTLAAGQTATASITLDGEAFEYYDASIDELSTRPGRYQILYGSSSLDKDLQSLDFVVK